MKAAPKAFTALAAAAVAVCTYSTLPEGRALTEQEKMEMRGRQYIPDIDNYACSTCDGPNKSCSEKPAYPSEGAQWVPGDPLEWPGVCDGTLGREHKEVGEKANTGAQVVTWDCINNTYGRKAQLIPAVLDEMGNVVTPAQWKFTWTLLGEKAARTGCSKFAVCTTYPQAGCGEE